MKGMEWRTLLGIVILVLLTVLIASSFILPIGAIGVDVQFEKDFRYYCFFWSTNTYRGTTVTMDGQEISMNPLCTRALGILCFDEEGCMPDNPSAPEWDECRNLCRLSKTEE